MKNNTEKLYLDLLKKTLTYSLWPEPPYSTEELVKYKIPLPEKLFCMLLNAITFFSREIKAHKTYVIDPEKRAEGMVWSALSDTMIGVKRLDNLQNCVETVLKEGIEGDLIEAGVWRGGACIFMRAILAAYGVTDRKVFVADSFQGLPPPDFIRYPADSGDRLHESKYLKVSMEEVKNNFRRYDLLDDQVVFIEGWFKDSLRDKRINKLAVIRLDGDMYGSTIEALDLLYPKLASGGFCIIDDYSLEPCRKAVEDYRAKHNIKSELITIDWTGRYWRK